MHAYMHICITYAEANTSAFAQLSIDARTNEHTYAHVYKQTRKTSIYLSIHAYMHTYMIE